MRFSKNFWIWLLETQIEELKDKDEIMKLANEFADIVGIRIQTIQKLTNEATTPIIIRDRIQGNINRIPENAYKYRNKWIEYEEKTKNYSDEVNWDRREK